MAYLLDTNVFIRAKNDHYNFHTVPGFWRWLDREHARGIVFSIQAVRKELLKKDDELAAWSDRCASGFFLYPSKVTHEAVATVNHWVDAQARFTSEAKKRFRKGADTLLVAQTLTTSRVVVTHEEPAPESKASVKLPDVCAGVNVEFMNPFRMLRAEGAVFELSESFESAATDRRSQTRLFNDTGAPSRDPTEGP